MEFQLDTLIRPNVKALKPYSSARDEFKDATATNMTFLDANENPFENGVNRYPDPHQRSLKAILATQKGVAEENILLGNGSDEVLDLIFRVFCEPKEDNILALPPTYGMYKVLAGINNIAVKEVVLDGSFQPNTEAILSEVDASTKLLFLCSPNNPTGNSFASQRIIELLKNFNGIVVIDEAYIDFSSQESWTTRLAEFPNLIVTQTLSKAYGMAGIRLGMCFASEEIIQTLKKIKPPYNVNELTQQKALSRIIDTEKIKNEIQSITKEKEKLTKVLLQVKFIAKIYPSDANFLLVKVDDANLRYQQLIAKGIVVRNRTTQYGCENCLRFTIGTEEENKKLVEALQLISKP